MKPHEEKNVVRKLPVVYTVYVVTSVPDGDTLLQEGDELRHTMSYREQVYHVRLKQWRALPRSAVTFLEYRLYVPHTGDWLSLGKNGNAPSLNY